MKKMGNNSNTRTMVMSTSAKNNLTSSSKSLTDLDQIKFPPKIKCIRWPNFRQGWKWPSNRNQKIIDKVMISKRTSYELNANQRFI